MRNAKLAPSYAYCAFCAALMVGVSALVEERGDREVVIESLKADCEVRRGRPLGL